MAVSIETTNRSTRDLPASVSSLEMDYAGGPNFTMRIEHHPSNPRPEASNFSVGTASAPVQYFEIDHSFSNGEVSGTTLGVSVNRSRLRSLGATVDDVRFARYHNGTWQELPATIRSVNATRALFAVQTPGFSLFAVEVPQPDISVTALAVNRSTVQVGEPVTLTASLENVGDLAGNTTLPVQQNGTTVTNRSVRVAANGTAQVSISRTYLAPGTYELTVGAESTSVRVNAAESTVPPTTTQPTTTSSPPEEPTTGATTTQFTTTDTLVEEPAAIRFPFGGVGVGAVIIIGLGYLIFREKRR